MNAWRLIRLSIERLYVIAYKKYGPPDFDPISWVDQTAEYMWNAGSGAIVEKFAPGSEKRLKEILDLSVSGAHDKAPRGSTDVLNATGYLQKLLASLQIID